ALARKTHQTIRKVTVDIEERFHLNTAISAIMELVNSANDALSSGATSPGSPVMRLALDAIVQLLNPFAPHITEELWTHLGGKGLLSAQSWPKYDAELAREEEATVVVQVNGKLRASLLLPRGTQQQDVLSTASSDERVRKHLENREIV